MKHLSLLFAIYLGVLTMAPAFVQLFPCMQQSSETMCKNECSESNKDCKDDGGENKCAFGICCSNCLFFNAEQKEITFILPSVNREKIAIINEHSCSSYIADCWHPPEIV